MKIYNYFSCLVMLLLITSNFLYADDLININTVSIIGNKKTDLDALKLQITAKKGQVSQSVVNHDVKALYATGFFEQVEARISKDEQGQSALKYFVIEKPIVRKVYVQGNKEVDKDDIEQVLDFKPGRFFDSLQIKRAIERTQSYYQGRGYFDCIVDYAVVPAAANQVDVNFTVVEGDKYKIRSVQMPDLKILDQGDLLSKIQTKTYKWWSSWLLGTGRLNEEMLENDRNIIRQELLNNGLVEGIVSEPSIKKEGKGLTISFYITEGDQYKVGALTSSGDQINSNSEETLKGITSKSGEVFNGSKLRSDSLKISEKFSDIGYAFVNVIPDTQINKSIRQVEVNFQVSKGSLITIDRINIRGNQKSYDNVIRREMAISEQDLFSSSKIKRSQELLQRRGYFEEVNIVPENIESKDKVNLAVNVKEGSTGTFSIGAGFSSSDGAIFNTRVSENNVFGTGRRANLEVDIGDRRNNIVLSFDDPRVADSQWSLGADLLKTERDFRDFDRGQAGGALSAGYDLESLLGKRGRDSRFSLRYQLVETEIDNIDPLSAAQLVIDSQGKSITSSITPSLTRNTINNPLDPSMGSKQVISTELAGLGGDEKFYLIELTNQIYTPFWSWESGDVVFSLRTKLGYGDTFNDEKFPLFQRYFPGGINSVRGFKTRRLGPKDENGNEFGGSKQIVNNTEVIFPLATSAGLKGVLFYDFGQAYDDDESLDVGELRHAVGYGIRWSSPLGPIRIEFGYPLNKKDNESSFVTLFSFGAPL